LPDAFFLRTLSLLNSPLLRSRDPPTDWSDPLGSECRLRVERASDAGTSPAYSFKNGGCGCIGVRDTAEVHLEVGLVGREGRCTRVLQASHVGGAQPASDRHPKYVTSSV
jgi:hypothetical protein